MTIEKQPPQINYVPASESDPNFIPYMYQVVGGNVYRKLLRMANNDPGMRKPTYPQVYWWVRDNEPDPAGPGDKTMELTKRYCQEVYGR